MNFANYAAFRQAVQQIIDGDDISQSSISTSILDLIISTGEQRVYRDVRSSLQDTALSVTATANKAPLPTDCIELKSLFFAGFPPLDFMPYQMIQLKIQLQQAPDFTSTLLGSSQTYSLEGENIIFWPAVTDGSVCNGRYIKRFPDITTSGLTGNTFFARFPDLWMYAALSESGPYIGERERLPEWKERYATIAMAANEFEKRRARAGSKLQMRIG